MMNKGIAPVNDYMMLHHQHGRVREGFNYNNPGESHAREMSPWSCYFNGGSNTIPLGHRSLIFFTSNTKSIESQFREELEKTTKKPEQSKLQVIRKVGIDLCIK